MPIKDLKPRWICFDGPVIKGDKGFFTPKSESDAIKASVLLSMGTAFNSMPHFRSFGSKLESLVFEPNDHILKSLATDYIRDALRYEPRVALQYVNATRDNTSLNFDVGLQETSSNEQFKMTFGYKLG